MRRLVLFPGALGDLCLLAPALATAAARGERVEVAVARTLEPVVELVLPAVTLGPSMDGLVMASLFASSPAPALAAWMHGADRVDAWLGRADTDGRLRRRLATLGGVVALHAVPRGDDGPHAGDAYAAALGLAGPPTPLRIAMPPTGVAPWSAPEASRVVLHPGSGAAEKRWDPRGFQAVADGLRRAGREVLVLLGPAEAGEAPAWHGTADRVVSDLTVVDAAALIVSAPAWLGNDSGMSQLAGVLARRGVVLFGPTRPARWLPRGGRLVPVEFRDRARSTVVRDALDRLLVGLP